MDKTTAGILAGVTVGLVVGAVLLSGEAVADRTDVWLSSSVSVYRAELVRLPDGGCAVQAYANVSKSDGGVSSDGSALTDVGGANRTTCLDVLDNKAPVLFKADKGL